MTLQKQILEPCINSFLELTIQNKLVDKVVTQKRNVEVAFFFTTEHKKEIAEELISILETKNGLNIANEVTTANNFWKGEAYH